jgi:hypothetical protein
MGTKHELIQGTKYDDGKDPLWFLDGAVMAGVARVLGFGAKKYSPHNWRKGMKWSRLYSAAMRHIFKHLDGEKLDPETGESHLDHAICCLMFLSHYEKRKLGTDDRWFEELARPGQPGPAEMMGAGLRSAVERALSKPGTIQPILDDTGTPAASDHPPVPKKKHRKKSVLATEDDVLTRLLEGRTLPELAKDLNISRSSAANWIHRLQAKGYKLQEKRVPAPTKSGPRELVRYTYA